MKIRLTQKRLRALGNAISLDDLLYERFRRLNDDLSRRERRFSARQIIREVVQVQGKNNVRVKLPILEVYDSGEGLTVVIGQ